MSKRKSSGNGRRTHVSAVDFVKAWVKGGTIADVAERAGVSIATAQGRAHRFRKAGVALPKLERRTHAGLDIQALNALLK